MDPILERFNRLIKSIFVDTDNIDFGYDNFSKTSDKDFSEAWDELNEFLSSPIGSSQRNTKYYNNDSHMPATPEMLRPDYINMGVPFGADFEIIKKAYKKLIIKNHPDKNSSTAESMNRATEKSKNLNISFQRIKAWELAQKG